MNPVITLLAKPLATAVIASCCIALGIITFGNPDIFDRLFLGVLALSFIICYNNINLLGILAIIAVARMAEELAWLLIGFEDIPWVKLGIYLLAGYCTWFFRYEGKVMIAVGLTVALSAGAELYWYITDYETPLISWHILLIFQDLWIRYFLLQRYAITEKFYPDKVDITYLEFPVRRIYLWFIFHNIIMLAEYLSRHILGASSLIVYDSFSYVAHGFGAYFIYLILMENRNVIVKRWLTA